MQNHTGKFIITTCKRGQVTYTVACFLCDDSLEYIKVLPEETSFSIGTIVTAKVKQVVPNIPAAFVALDQNTMAFLPTIRFENPVLTNSYFSGKLRSGDELLVQVTKDAVKTKDAVVSHEISLQGIYCVVKNGTGIVNFSKQLNHNERSALLQMLQKKAICTSDKALIGMGMDQISITIRTKAKTMHDDKAISDDILKTIERYQELIRKAKMRTCYTVHQKKVQDLNVLIGDVQKRGFIVEEVVTDLSSVMENLQAARYYNDTSISLSMLYGLSTKIDALFQKRVWLACGGYLIIEPTEAMTVIDVNSGKAIGTKNSEELVELVNREAAIEIARQIRLRNISGMILVDYINYNKRVKELSEENIIKLMEAESSSDVSNVTYYGFTRLGLLELTRDKLEKPLYEAMNESYK